MSKLSPTSLQIPLYSTLSLLIFTLPFLVNSQITDPELAILLKLKQHWSNPPSIKHWNSSSLNSNSNPTHCTWPEITCTGGSVIGLSLGDKNITGTIPPFICDLQNLTLLDLNYNNIPGPFPTILYNCSKLQYLDLSSNYFVAPIPGDIHRLSSRLRDLNLSYNNFSGDIPASIGRLSELRTLHIEQNEFNGTFPQEIGNLSNLELLWMGYNAFAPSKIPSSFTQLKKLENLFLSTANLIGEIPETIGNMTALKVLDLSTNQLTGNIPSGVFLLKNLISLFLYNNKLSGVIPRSVEALNLDVIDFSENNLTGTIPEEFGKLTKLTDLALFFNQLSGEIPPSIGGLPALQVIKCFSNNLSGQLPPDFGRYSMLRDFQVADNPFRGRLPDYLCANRVLGAVVAFNNNLTGELPSSLENCRSLKYVQVYGNRLSGNIPAGLWTSFNLTWLMMSDNLFTGHLPDNLTKNLSRLEINNNRFSGEIPARISSLRSLTVLEASNNLFTGTIPQELTVLPLLATLLLDRNRLSGQFPSEIVSWKSLTNLNLSGNQLSGTIPAEIGSLPVLTDLDLSGNEFSGQIPPQIGHLNLNLLNLSSNSLTGRIPVKFENAGFDHSFLNNPGLCSSKPSLGLEVCSSGARKSGRMSPQLFAMLTSIASVLFVLAIIFTFFVIKVYRKRELRLDSTWKVTSFQRLNFTEASILSSLTENCMIGSGGAGKVYRVAVNRSGVFVAVKRIWNNRKLEQRLEKQFLAEVEILGTIHHSNIVKLLCCMSNETSKLLVYEYLENGSLDEWLHRRKRQPSVPGSVHHVVLDWPKRFQIAVGAARGLCYMHHDCTHSIVHRDVKSSNILLDSEFNAKIADFGLAKMLIKHGEPNTVSDVAGSFGYIASEFALTTRVNEKIDVYGFGVVLLELATGRKANDGDENMGLAEWASHQLQEGNSIEDALDEEIKEPCYLEEMSGVFRLGINCTCTLPSTRFTMKEVLQILLRCNRSLAFKQNNGGSEYDATPPGQEF